jgi:outer membrane protein assembly factor BamB
MPQGPGRQHFHYMDADRDNVLTRLEYEFIAEVFNRSQNALLAIRPPAGGEAVGAAEVVWSHTRGLPYVPTPLLYRGRLYLLKNGGLLTCLNATHGAVLYQEERIGLMGDNYASPVAADGRVVIASQNGGLAVLAAGDALEVLSRQALGEPILATPAIGQDALYVRSRGFLWAFRESPAGQPAP